MEECLETERLIIRSVRVEDAAMLAKWKSQFNLREMSVGLKTLINTPNQRRDIRATLQQGDLYLIIEIKNSQTPIGYIRLGWLDDSHNRCWLSYGLASHYREGYCFEALDKLLHSLYKYKLINIIDAEVFEFNIASQKLLKKLGFKYTGKRRNEYYYKKTNWSIFKYQLSPEDVENGLE
ncbi:MAG: GNAT family protein [Oscillospiraceae bacterium]